MFKIPKINSPENACEHIERNVHIPSISQAFLPELFKWSDAIFPSRGHDGQVKYQSSSRTMV